MSDGLGNSTKFSYSDKSELIDKLIMPTGGEYLYSYDTADRVIKMSSEVSSIENANFTEYTAGDVTKLNHSGNIPITYEYDGKRRLSKIYIGGELYESYAYEEDVEVDGKTADKVTRTDAAGNATVAVADKLQSFNKIYYNEELIFESDYDRDTRVRTDTDYKTGISKEYKYDLTGKLYAVAEYKDGEWQDGESYFYNAKGLLMGDGRCSYSYDGLGQVVQTVSGPFEISRKKDMCGRFAGKTVSAKGKQIADENVSYLQRGEYTTETPSEITCDGKGISYVYDDNGNITEIKREGVTVAKYTYDEIDRLVREDNKDFNKSYIYEYDNNGNITSKMKCSYTLETPENGVTERYTYANGRLSAYRYYKCEYDELGNPVKYRDKTAEWSYGKRLASYNGNTFGYSADGTRIKKNDIIFKYDSSGRLIKQSNGVEFYYDGDEVIGFSYKGKCYYYRKDMQGNVNAILDKNGKAVVEYYYTAWGEQKFAASDEYKDVARINPFRYRSYYYDEETDLYYLKTRYYDPEVGRFISQDSIDYLAPDKINGFNLYAYCGNNPVMNIDPSGEFFLAVLAAMAVSGLITGTIKGITTAMRGGSSKESWGAFASGLINGAALGGALAIGGLIGGGAVLSLGAKIFTASYLTLGTFALGTLASLTEDAIKGNPIDINNMLINGAFTFMEGIFSFGLGAALGVAGFMEQLKPGNGIIDVMKTTKYIYKTEVGKFGFCGFMVGIGVYLKEYIGAMTLKTFLNWTFVTVWDFIRPKKGG